MKRLVNREIVSRNFLEAVAKLVLFSREVDDLIIDAQSGFDKGIYSISCCGSVDEFEDKPFIEDIVDEHVVCKDLVGFVLDNEPGTRDDDMLLLFAVWRAQGISFDLNNVDVRSMFSSETVTRSRRKLQNDDGLFLPTKASVARRRGINEGLLRQHYGGC